MPDQTGAPHGGAALLRRTSVLAAGQNLGAGGIHFHRAFEISQDSIKITTPNGVVIFMEATPGFEPGNQGFADPRLTTWLCRHILIIFYQKRNYTSRLKMTPTGIEPVLPP